MALPFKKQITWVHPEARYKGFDHAAKVALQFNVDYATCLGMVSEARNRGLMAPVVLMGKVICAVSYQ